MFKCMHIDRRRLDVRPFRHWIIFYSSFGNFWIASLKSNGNCTNWLDKQTKTKWENKPIIQCLPARVRECVVVSFSDRRRRIRRNFQSSNSLNFTEFFWHLHNGWIETMLIQWYVYGSFICAYSNATDTADAGTKKKLNKWWSHTESKRAWNNVRQQL